MSKLRELLEEAREQIVSLNTDIKTKNVLEILYEALNETEKHLAALQRRIDRWIDGGVT